jgi:site-specific recombinase XerD
MFPMASRRTPSATCRLTDLLAKTRYNRSQAPQPRYVFASETGEPYLVTSVDHMHNRVRTALGMPPEFVVYSLRHSYGSRLAESGADPFSIKKLMGHGSITVSQRYCHLSQEALGGIVERMQAMNASKMLPNALKTAHKGGVRQLSITVSTTVEEPSSVSC